MPYTVVEQDDEYCVYKVGEDGEPVGDSLGCHPTAEEAGEQIGAIEAEEEKSVKAKWSTAYINDLPDSAFLWIAPDGEKDDEGKTTPRSLRYFPYKDAEGNVDLPHLRNAIARIPQAEHKALTADKKRSLQEKARGILEEHTEKMLGDDAIVSIGSAVKALGDGKVGGYLVEFTDAKHPDLESDYFDWMTDFGRHGKSLAFYHHGADKTLGRKPLKNMADLEQRDAGVWFEHQLDLRDEYESAIYRLAEEGKIGLSSGTAPHLVEREKKGDVHHITRWPLGLDASYTPTPANWQSRVMPLKSYVKSVGSAAELELGGDDLPAKDAKETARAARPEGDGSETTERAPAEAVADGERAAARLKAKAIDALLQMEDENGIS